MYNDNMNYEGLLIEEINLVEEAFKIGAGVKATVTFEGTDIYMSVTFKHDGITFFTADYKEYNDNYTTEESINAAIEKLKIELLGDVLRYIIGRE